MSQVLDKQIREYLSLLHDDEKKSILSVIKSFLSNRKQPERVSIEQYNKELDEAEADYENGDFISHEEMIKQIKKW